MYLVLVLYLCGVNSDTVDSFADRLQKETTCFASVLPSGRMKRLDSRGTDFLNTVSYMVDVQLKHNYLCFDCTSTMYVI
jgi:hypothetical protein